MCTVRLRHKDEDAKCGFLVVVGDGSILLGMMDVKLLNILNIECEVIGDPHESRKFNMKTTQASNIPSCKTNKGQQIKTDNVHVHDANANMPG